MNLVCPDCKNPVEIIKACGCRDYFCNHCNQLVSKRKVIDLDLPQEDQKIDTEDESLPKAVGE